MAKSGNIETFNKGLGFCGALYGSNWAEVDVKDGKIVRIRPAQYDKEYSWEHMKPWTIKARGKEYKAGTKTELPPISLVYKKRAYSPNRIPYPLKRVDWDPNGERNPQNRGKSKYVRISWDEATDIIASEIKRVQETYSPYSVLLQGDGHAETKGVHGPHGMHYFLMRHTEGFTYQMRQPDSWEGWYWGAKHVWGGYPVGKGNIQNLLMDIARNCEMMLLWGCDMETTTWGWGGHQSSKYCFWLTELGVKQVYICPDVNYGCAVHADKWIPILPNTDAALHLAIIYVWLKEGTWDEEYINTHAVGMEHIKKYVLGQEDGTPKTPEWAEPITGVPVRTIKALARQWAKKATTTAHCNGGGKVRGPYSSEATRLEICSLAMQGLGKPGRNMMSFIEWQLMGEISAAPRPEFVPNLRNGAHMWPGSYEETPSFIPRSLIAKALTGNYTHENPLTWHGYCVAALPRAGQFIKYQYPIPGASEIRMVWTDVPCWTTCWNGGNLFIEGLRDPKIECVVAQHQWFENDCLMADVILPISTKFEEEDIGNDLNTGNFNFLFYEGRCIEPVGEAKSDWDAVGEVAKKMGLYEEFCDGNTVQDFIKMVFDSSGVNERISYEEFMKKGYYAVPTADDWESDPCGFAPFCEDPENNPVWTPSGKLELYSEDLATHFPDDEERPPSPKYIAFGESHQESLSHPRAEKYPYLLVTNHARWRVHSQLDDISWFREIQTCKVKGPDGYQYEPVWINTKDAEKLGVETGDVVKIFNERGGVLGGVYKTERVMPGAIYQDHGARMDPIDPGKLDRGGANNLICPTNTTSKNCAGEATNGYLVNVEKCDLDELVKQYPEAMSRTFDGVYGIAISNWITEG